MTQNLVFSRKNDAYSIFKSFRNCKISEFIRTFFWFDFSKSHRLYDWAYIQLPKIWQIPVLTLLMKQYKMIKQLPLIFILHPKFGWETMNSFFPNHKARFLTCLGCCNHCVLCLLWMQRKLQNTSENSPRDHTIHSYLVVHMHQNFLLDNFPTDIIRLSLFFFQRNQIFRNWAACCHTNIHTD